MSESNEELLKRLNDLLKEKDNMRRVLDDYKLTNIDLSNTLDQIYSSNGWRILSKYYKWRDRIKLSIPRLKNKNHKFDIGKELLLEQHKVSVIIPIYNNSDFLDKCIKSALNQTYENLEVVAVDDCSTDESVFSIIQKYIGNEKFKYFKNELNSGISSTMNNAIIKAEGDWIAFLDCDDWLEEDAVIKLMSKINEKEDNVYGYTDRMNEVDGESHLETFRNRPTVSYFEELLKGMYTSHLKIIKKSAFLKIGLHESRFDGAQDYDIALKTAFHFGDSFAYLSEPVYHHRVHNKQTTIKDSEKIENIRQTIKKEANLRDLIRKGEYERKVSFVILSFEKREMTLKCVRSIQDTVKMPYEIIIFDNASSEETIDYLRRNVEVLDNVSIHYSNINLGCPGGRRKAIKLADGDYVVNLDNDIIVTEGWIEELIVRSEQSDDIGAVCCKTVFPNGKVQFNGATYSLNDHFISFTLSQNDKDESDVETALWQESKWVPGGATLFKKSLIEVLDYSEGYINAFEDNDVALQISKLGYRMLNCPTAKVYHYHFMFNEEPQKEQRYKEVRYKESSFIKSLIHFYHRNGLIIKDQYVFRLLGVEGMSAEVITEKVKDLEKEYYQLEVQGEYL